MPRRRSSTRSMTTRQKARYASWDAAAEYADERTGADSFDTERDDRWMSTGVLTQDLVLGGGFCEGRITVLWGAEAEGKSTQLYMGIMVALRRGDVVLMYDHEGSFDIAYLKTICDLHAPRLDVDQCLQTKQFRFGPVRSGEQTFRHLRRTLRKLPDAKDRDYRVLVCIDSIAAMISEDEVKDEDTEKVRRDRGRQCEG